MAAGAVVLAVLLRRWRAPRTADATAASSGDVLDASPDELRRLEAAVRDDQ
jgi:hypothetical protein